MDFLPLIIQIVTGIIGGHAVSGALKQTALGSVGRSIAGALGGVGGTAILASLGAGDMTGAMGALAGSAISGVAGGGIVSGGIGAIIGLLKKR
jgi:hypothetical protein